MNVTTTSPNISSSSYLSSSSETEWELMPEPDISEVVIEDEQPVDNLISEKQQRLLTSSAYSSLNVEIPFLVTANVGLFYAEKKPPLVPDVMLSLKVKCPEDWSQKKNRSYFTWNFGKSPEIAIEIVSNKVGNELGSKFKNYLDAGVDYYVIFDPLKYLSKNVLQVYKKQVSSYQLQEDYWLEAVNLGLTLWSGEFEGQFYQQWLRWCDKSGNILLTGDEKFELEKQRAETEKQRAETEKQRAETEKQRAETEKQRADHLAQILREQGIDPDLI
ncbi:Uma2 family endonuclease [Crocosphaera sp. XPORK-15E]|uniref:Uma2 family endonuclease n=1 Tax=Crocosphaera sp. XPORK-15E TaxID=3110247 RepID=UPI002B217AEA|nr:Uma2 family endonuclease [Crocosphaera sp. XPORK-15E]MEA5533896.1 Uma2 family endonuclease [Crocosphaera sp. XPORK-15E]